MNEWREATQRRYAQHKAQGESFFPYVVFKDVIAITVVFAMVVCLAIWGGVPLEDLADPADTAYNPRPEWYFLPLFQLLKFFPGSLEVVAIAIIPFVALSFLILLPFIDRGPERSFLDRPFLAGLGVLAIVGAFYLGLDGYYAPLTNSVAEKNPHIQEGKKLYAELYCKSCHSVGGRGGVVGPALDLVGSYRGAEWLSSHFQNPRKITPGSVMSDFGLLEQEIESLVAYMRSLGDDPLKRAAALFKENCASCHKLGGVGEEIGPDLDRVGLRHNQEWLARYIARPEEINPDTAMPGFADILSAEEREDISRYLAAQSSN